MALDDRLLAILACPQDKEQLLYFEDEAILYNPRIKCSYPIREGIPVLLTAEAQEVSEGEHERLMTLRG